MPQFRLVPDGFDRGVEERQGLEGPVKAVIVKLLALFTLKAPLPWWAIMLQASGSVVVSWWTGLDQAQHLLITLMTFDYALGTVQALRDGSWTWPEAWWGLTRKGATFIAAFIFGDVMQQHGLGQHKSAWTVFYTATECISIARKLKASGVPVAPPLLELFRNLTKTNRKGKR